MSIKKQTEYQRGVAINNEGIQINEFAMDRSSTDSCKKIIELMSDA